MESSTILKPDILTVIEKECIELQQRGRHFWACCPLHSERTASFCVDMEKQRFKCFGCGVGGDAIDFVMKLKRLSFPDALRYLGISGDSRKIKSDLQELKKRKLIQKYRRWIQLYRRAICELLRLANRIDLQVTTPKDLELPGISGMYLKKFIYEYHLNILNGDDAETKFELYKEVYYGRNNDR
jgi:hypothetical protein